MEKFSQDGNCKVRALIARHPVLSLVLIGCLSCDEELKASIAMIKGVDLVPLLTIANFARSLQHHNVKFSNIVIAQALLETGYFTSRIYLEHNNLFGLRRPSDGPYYRFLQRIGYAEDVEYVRKVRAIAMG